MESLFDEADAIADRMRTRAGFTEADLAPMFLALCRRNVAPSYKDKEIRDLFDLWLDHHRVHRSAERRGLIERMPHLLRERERLLTAMSLGDMAEPEKVAAGLRVQSLANEIAPRATRAYRARTGRCLRTRPLGRDSLARKTGAVRQPLTNLRVLSASCASRADRARRGRWRTAGVLRVEELLPRLS